MEEFDAGFCTDSGSPPHAFWPGDARVAVQFVVNYEEGGENSVLHGDPAAEGFLSDMVGAAQVPGQRHIAMESLYEYGSNMTGLTATGR